MSRQGEVLLTIMSSLAQEESRSISQNVTWGQRRRFAAGRASVAFSSFLGYEKGEDGKWIVNEKQAETVRLIYKLFLEGNTYADISRTLVARNILTPEGKEKWSISTIKSILSNLMLAIWIQSSVSRYVNNAAKSSVSAAFGSGGVQNRGI